MPSKQKTRIIFDELEAYYFPYNRFKSLSRVEKERINVEFDFAANKGYARNEWKFIGSRIIPYRIEGKMRFFLEIIIERKTARLSHKEYLKRKRSNPDFNYVNLYKSIEILPIDNGCKIYFPHEKARNWDPNKEDTKTFRYDLYAKKYPKIMTKTLNEAKNRIEKFISKKTIAY